MVQYRVQCCTYNGHLSKGSPETAVAEWLGPTLEQSRTDKDSITPPDFVAVGFQEMIPLHFALGGFSRPTLDFHDGQLKAAVESHAGHGETYTLIAKHTLAGIALLVFARDRTATRLVSDVRLATAGTGVARVMGNKGAVGVRVTLHDGLEQEGEKGEKGEKRDEDEDEDWEGGEGTSFTFVTAHLAAHQGKVARRAEDWRAIVERLVFTPFGPSADFVPHRRRNPFKALERYNPKAMGGPVLQVYDSSYLFVFGDLNYRVDWPKDRAAAILPAIASDLPSVLALDQLARERAAGRTLHHLHEGAIAFPPTYKFKVGTDTYKHAKRIPSWCDRVLYATWADEGGEERGGAEVELYQSAHKFKGSDHKPVTAIVALPEQPSDGGELRIPHKAPFAVDPLWRRKLLAGWALDRIVGAVWCLIMLLGFNKDARLGLGNAMVIAAATYYRQRLFGL